MQRSVGWDHCSGVPRTSLGSVKRPWVQSPRLSQVIDKATRPCMALRTAPGFFTDRRGSGQGAEVVLDTVPVRMRAHDKN